MDTNQIAELIASLSAARAESGINWNVIINTALGILGTAITGLMAMLLSRLTKSSEAVEDNTAEIKIAAATTAVSAEKVYVAVNSKETILSEIQKLSTAILKLQDKEVVKEKSDSQIAEARIGVAKEVEQAVTAATVAQLKKEIEELKAKP